MDIAPSRRLPLLLQQASAADLERVRRHDAMLARLAGLASVRALDTLEAPPPAAMALVGQLALLVPMAGLIEPRSELVRLGKRLQKVEQERARAAAKLANPNFVDHAPPEVVAQERARLADFERALAGLSRQLEQVRALERLARDA
jgi:valyl-tRNA synthetase